MRGGLTWRISTGTSSRILSSSRLVPARRTHPPRGDRPVFRPQSRGSGSIGGTNSEEASMMDDVSTPIGQPAAVNPPGKLAYATPTTAPLVAGRRSFFKYRDLGVTAASSGKIRAQVTIGAEGMTQPTGWHYHVCEGQFVYMLSGWVDLEFEDGQKLRIQSGESLYIPGGLRHNETAASRDLELLELSVPADMGTVPCDPPEGWSKSL
ncbi:MAG: hypothetical protein DMF83_30670 [Acidobacteria bacterium]|nr:MAG: hypothetical protein DMF83_30670 [Acidobacteriota bacterium]